MEEEVPQVINLFLLIRRVTTVFGHSSHPLTHVKGVLATTVSFVLQGMLLIVLFEREVQELVVWLLLLLHRRISSTDWRHFADMQRAPVTRRLTNDHIVIHLGSRWRDIISCLGRVFHQEGFNQVRGRHLKQRTRLTFNLDVLGSPRSNGVSFLFFIFRDGSLLF